MSDTIAAIATGGGLSAIGIIRLSGDRAIEIADLVFKTETGLRMQDAESRKLCYGRLYGTGGGVIDMCLCTVSRTPHSYTGEDTAELQCHGSPVVLGEGLRALFEAGARQAKPGEFTERAFLNGRIDLTQAEAVIDIIDAETVGAARNAVGQLGRAIGKKTDDVYDRLLDMMSHFHAVLDYPDEEIEDFQLENYKNTLSYAEKTFSELLSTFGRGRILKEGIRCAVIGKPNTGKSSLMNALLGYDRAIVTDIAGTTRDTIEEKVRLGDVLLRLCDTAGIRETGDAVEREGVHRAMEAASDAELVLAVFDGGEILDGEDMRVLETAAKAPRAIAVVNKSDREMKANVECIEERIPDMCVVSALERSGLDVLSEKIGKLFILETDTPIGEILTSERQAEAVKRALNAVSEAKLAIDSGITPDAVLTWVEAAAGAVGELTGKILREDVTARIFSRFCVGK